MLFVFRQDSSEFADVADDSLQLFGELSEEPSEDARPHIEVERDGRMAWIVDERGAEMERRPTLDRDELLYWIFESVTWLMAYQEARGAPGDDFRRILFTRQLELLRRLKSDWRDRMATQKAEYLRSRDGCRDSLACAERSVSALPKPVQRWGGEREIGDPLARR